MNNSTDPQKESSWAPKNLIKMHPHVLERRLYIQKQIANKVNGEDIAKLAMNNWKATSNNRYGI